MDAQTIQKMIDTSITNAFQFGKAKYGDTPTDANQLVNKRYVDNQAIGYGGLVNANGTAGALFPKGWSVSKIGNGTYKITHNLNTTNYVIMTNPTFPGNLIEDSTNVYAQNANDCTIQISNTSAEDRAFYFLLLKTTN